MLRLLSCTGFAIALAVAPAQSQEVFIADLRGANENPPVASTASGSALVLLDPTAQTMTVRTVFSGLSTPTVDAHIHCCAPPTGNAGVAIGFRPAGFPLGVTEGAFNATFDLNGPATYNPPFVTNNGGNVASARTAFLNGTRGGLAYVNIHTTRFPGGEIRGQLFTSRDLTAEAFSLLPEVALQTAEFHDSGIRRYLRDVRGGREGPAGQTATMGEDGRIGLFLMGQARSGEFESRTGRPRVDLEARGLMGGIDYRFGPATLIGVTAGYDSSDVRLTPASRESDVKSWFVGAYGSVALGPAHLDLHASRGEADHELFRSISAGPFSAESAAEADSDYWMLAGTAGLRLDPGEFEIEPYAGVRYVSLDIDGFAETGNIAALTIDAAEIDSLQSIAGLSVGADVPLGRWSVRPALRGEWRHEFENDSRLIAGSFGGAAPFGFATTPLGDDHFVLGGGLSVSAGGSLALTADYTAQLAGGYDIHALTGGLRVSF